MILPLSIFPVSFASQGFPRVRDGSHVFSNPQWTSQLLSEKLLNDSPKQWCTHCLLFHCFFLQVVNFMNLWQECYGGFFSWLGGKFVAEYRNLPIHYPMRKKPQFLFFFFLNKKFKSRNLSTLKSIQRELLNIHLLA